MSLSEIGNWLLKIKRGCSGSSGSSGGKSDFKKDRSHKRNNIQLKEHLDLMRPVACFENETLQF